MQRDVSGNSLRIVQSDYALINASLEWLAGETGFRVKLFGRNLTDRAVITTTILQDVADGVGFAPRELMASSSTIGSRLRQPRPSLDGLKA